MITRPITRLSTWNPRKKTPIGSATPAFATNGRATSGIPPKTHSRKRSRSPQSTLENLMERSEAARKLSVPKNVFDGIVRWVSEAPHGCETGVTLFGTFLEGAPDSHYIVLAIAGPGRRATHEPMQYSGDENHANEIYDALRSALPGIRWLGELHVHPKGMTHLSCGDL